MELPPVARVMPVLELPTPAAAKPAAPAAAAPAAAAAAPVAPKAAKGRKVPATATVAPATPASKKRKAKAPGAPTKKVYCTRKAADSHDEVSASAPAMPTGPLSVELIVRGCETLRHPPSYIEKIKDVS